MMLLRLLLVYSLVSCTDSTFNNTPDTVQIPKYHESYITVWEDIDATCTVSYTAFMYRSTSYWGGWRGWTLSYRISTTNYTSYVSVQCNSCQVVNGTGFVAVGKNITKNPCSRDDGGYCLDVGTTAVQVECWHDGYQHDGRTATSFQVVTKMTCEEPVQKGYILDTEGNKEYDVSTSVDVLSCGLGFSGMPSENKIYCRQDGTWDNITGCVATGCGTPLKLGYRFGIINDTSPGSNVSISSCDTGYSGTPSVKRVTCLEDFSWADVTGCYPTRCEPTTIINGDIDFTGGIEYKSVAKITCREGYQVNGSDTMTCQENGIWNLTSECILRDCGIPHEISNGKALFENAETTYGQILSIICNTGYELTDGNGTECRSDGQWSTGTTCQPKDCGNRFTIRNGMVNFTGAVTTYGNRISIICNKGFELIGGAYIQCTTNGEWISNGTCNVIDCRTNYVIQNGHADFANRKTTFGHFIPIICNNGYMLKGGQGIECLGTGHWSNYTTCEILDECWPYTTDSTEPSKCRVPLLPYGEEAGDDYLPKEDDICGNIIHTEIDIPIFGITHNKIIPSTNGYITFDTKYNKWRPPGDIKEIQDRTLFAPYFSDIDIRGTHGNVYYQTYSSFSDSTRSQTVQLTETYIRDMMRDEDFNARFVLVVTWDDAPSYPYYGSWWCFWWRWWGCSGSDHVTFQLVLVSDGVDSYVMYIYKENYMNWRQRSSLWRPNILIGVTVKGGQHYRMHPYSFTTLSLGMDHFAGLNGIKGVWLVPLRQPRFRLPFQNYALLCLVWYHFVKEQQTDPRLLNDCPCDAQTLRWDPWFSQISKETPNTVCYDSWTWRRSYPNTIRCCYDRRSGGWISSDPRAGGFLFYDPRSHPTFHQLYDVDTRRHCCDLSDNCDKYRQLRPIGTCYRRSWWRRAIFFGDPHISSLDGKRYTFNGLGEYTLLDIQTSNTTFALQGRTERIIDNKGKPTNATIFSAFAAKDDTNSTIQVGLSSNKTEMEIYANGIDLTSKFLNESAEFLPWIQENLILTRDNKTLKVLFTASGIQLGLSVGMGMLVQETTVPDEFRGHTRGLLGNHDGDPDNDFVFSNGYSLHGNATESEIFPFGQSWMTTTEQSIFEYPAGTSHANFSYPGFTPMFLDEADEAKVQNATLICGTEDIECIYDMVMTGNQEIAMNTKQTGLEHKETVNATGNSAPLLNGTKKVTMTYGETRHVLITGFDETDLTFALTNDSAAELVNATTDSVYVKFHASNSLTDEISIYATDTQGKSSAPFMFEIVLCSGCNKHGTCNFEQFREETKLTDLVKIATCDCVGDGENFYWTGLDCEVDFDGCASEPCATGQTCTDMNATSHFQYDKAYECSACPPGYVLNDTKCQAVNMCENTNHGCEQVCEVIEGGYECLCDTGYRQSSTNQSACDDIDECEELSHSCQHRCINTPGSYNCSCHSGYTLNNDDQHSCQLVEDVCVGLPIDCSAAAGCINETGQPTCFCNRGYDLTEDGLTCRDTDECQRNICSQLCTNTAGRFQCSCLPGYELLDDGSTCEECNSTSWGNNCQELCECGPGSSGCDKVRGCVCDNGWSGGTCSEDVDECLESNACGDIYQICRNTYGSYDCSCRDGYTYGDDYMCKDINECEDPGLNTCEHTCKNVIGSFTCSCNVGYIQDSNDPHRCQDLDECITGISECEQNCKNVPGGYNCYCYYGYVLNYDRRTCSKVEDFCKMPDSLNCSHICGMENGKPVCHCPIGYQLALDKMTCVDVNECADPSNNLCFFPDTCFNYNGGYVCSCPVGYRLENDRRTCVACDRYHYGTNCEQTCNCLLGAEYCHSVAGCICLPGWAGSKCGADKNECDTELSPCIGENAQCVNTVGSFNCNCQTGFGMVNGQCIDIDECASPELNNCDQLCSNTVGSFLCLCTDGFILINGTCTDINECSSGINNCQHTCSNTLGGYRCRCEQGFRLDLSDGHSCIAETECMEQNKTQCAAGNADCVVRDNEPVCVCQKGYLELNGKCEDIRECELHPCDHVCHEVDGGYDCSCQFGYKLGPDQKTCQVCDEGTWGEGCIQTCNCNPVTTIKCSAETGICSCQEGWTGETCEEDVNECLDRSSVCPENSECVNVNGSFICECAAGFTQTSGGFCTECGYGRWGGNCAKQCICSIDHTSSCNTTNGHCQCMDGWTSETCSEDINECIMEDVCNATTENCINTEGSYTCTCKNGFLRNENKQCEACDVELFGEVCSSECDCVAENSQTGTSDCDEVTGLCLCLPGWTGNTCNIDVDECDTGAHNCGVNICHNTPGSFNCECEQGADGKCEETNSGSSENLSLIIGLGIGLPAAAVIIAIAIALVVVYLKGSATTMTMTRIVPFHAENVLPSFKPDGGYTTVENYAPTSKKNDTATF